MAAALLSRWQEVSGEHSAKADANAQDTDGDTPLDWAKGKPEIATLLRKHGGKTGAELKAE